MSDLDDILAHHGVKGMKWGVRKDRGHEGERATNKKIAKLDKKFEKNAARLNAGKSIGPEFHNALVTRVNSRVQDLNDSPKWRSKDIDTLYGKLLDEYNKDASEVILSSAEDATRQIFGSNKLQSTKRGVYQPGDRSDRRL